MLKIVTYPHPALIKKCEDIHVFNDELNLFVDEMFILMKEQQGIGLAANQTGISKNIFIMEINEQKFVFINPKILSHSEDKINFTEGCLSFPLFTQDTKRFSIVNLEWQDLEGKIHQNEFKDLPSICIQHELEHLNGKTFLDSLSSLKKQFALKKYSKIKKT